MITFLKKKRLSLLVILFCAFLPAVFYSIPISAKFSSGLQMLQPLFNARTPIIHLQTEGLSFDRPTPYKITLENGVQILFDETADSTALLSAQNYSVSIAQNNILYKINDQIKSISLENIEIDRDYIEIDPVKVGRLLQRISSALVVVTGLVLFVLLFVVLYLVALLAGGLGIMVDAFSNGPFTFGILFNAAAILLFVAVINWIFWGLCSFKHFKTVLILFFLIYLILVYWTIRSSKRYDFS